MGRLPLTLIISSVLTLAGWGQALAQDRHVDIPATEVRRMLSDEGCPNTSAQGYGKRLESDKHRLCLALALYAHGCLPDPRGQRTGLAFARGFACYQGLNGQSEPKRDRSAPRSLGDVFWPDDAMILQMFAGHFEGSPQAQTVRATQDAPSHVEAMVAEAAQLRNVSPAIAGADTIPSGTLRPLDQTIDIVVYSEAFAKFSGADLANDLVCKGISMCHDAGGDRIRLSRKETFQLRAHQGLRALGCSERPLGVEILATEFLCFQRFLGLPEDPESERDLALLHEIGISGDRRQVLRILERLRYKPGGGHPEAAGQALVDPTTILTGRSDAALYIHPKGRPYWGSAAFDDIRRYLNGNGGGMWVATRWPDLRSFAGREMSITDGGIEPLLIHFGATGASVVSAGGASHAADYSNEGGFDCIPNILSLRGHCLGLVVQRMGGNSASPWLLRAALRGTKNPIVFGTVTEGRAAFELATASYADAEAATDAEQASAQARLAAGEELESLPLQNVEAGAAFYARQVYTSPTRPDTEFVSQARIPFLAYHTAYATACASDFDGVAQIWRDVGTRLTDFSEVPGNRFRIYEEYIRTEMPILETAYNDFAQAIEVWRNGWFLDAGRAINYYPYAADFLAMLDSRFVSWAVAWTEIIDILGCRGVTIDRLEANLLVSHALIDGQ